MRREKLRCILAACSSVIRTEGWGLREVGGGGGRPGIHAGRALAVVLILHSRQQHPLHSRPQQTEAATRVKVNLHGLFLLLHCAPTAVSSQNLTADGHIGNDSWV